MSVGVKVKNGVSHGLSLQMALLHLKWQQIRQMELESLPEDTQDLQERLHNFSLLRQPEEICTAA